MLPDRSFFHRLAEAAKAETLPRFRAGIDVVNKEAKGFDPVTEGDRAAEEAIRALIESEFPDHGVLGEEHGSVGLDREYVWVIDPIDGTRAFISGVPVWGTLIGLQKNGRATMGLIDQPFTGERYFADGNGATYSGPDGLSSPVTSFPSTARSRARSGSSAMAAIAMPMRCLLRAMSISSSRIR